jgi:hypothetical protein
MAVGIQKREIIIVDAALQLTMTLWKLGCRSRYRPAWNSAVPVKEVCFSSLRGTGHRALKRRLHRIPTFN